MEGASAAITFIQLGLSIATTLNTYIADVRHGRDDIANLANEIEATVSHAQELDKLIQENKLTVRWSQHGLFLAQKCLTDCHDVIKRLSALLRRSGGTAPGIMPVLNGADDGESNDTKSLISRTDIDISNFNRLYWPLLKPQLQYLKQELQKIKIEILLAVNTYQVNATPKADERKAIAERIVALWRSRTVARRQLVVYGRELEAPYDNYYGRYTPVLREPRAVRDRQTNESRQDQYTREQPRGQDRDVSPALSYRSHRSYRRRRRTEIVRDESPGPRIIVKESIESLPSSFGRRPETGPPFAPDPEYVGEKSKGRQIIDYALRFILGPDEDTADTKQNLTHLWDSCKNNPAALKSILNKTIMAVPTKPANPSPLALRDPNSPSGNASTWSLLISHTSSDYAVQPITYPPGLLSKRLLREERRSRKSGSLNLQAYNTLSTLPEAYQRMITRWLHPDDSAPFHWELLLLDPTYGPAQGDSSQRIRLIQKIRRAAKRSPVGLVEPTSVLAVFKRCMRPDNDASSFRSRSQSSDDDERRAHRRRKMRDIALAIMGALAASDRFKDKPSSPRSLRGRRRYRGRSSSPPAVSRERRWDDNRWRPARERSTGRVYEMYETEEQRDTADGPDEDLAEKIVTEYTGDAGDAAQPNGATNGLRPNGVMSENISDTPTANDGTAF